MKMNNLFLSLRESVFFIHSCILKIICSYNIGKGCELVDIMKPIYREQLPIGEEFIYEVKYDGFRAILIWDLHEVKLMSRNNVDLTGNFPEIEHYCKSIQ